MLCYTPYCEITNYLHYYHYYYLALVLALLLLFLYFVFVFAISSLHWVGPPPQSHCIASFSAVTNKVDSDSDSDTVLPPSLD